MSTVVGAWPRDMILDHAETLLKDGDSISPRLDTAAEIVWSLVQSYTRRTLVEVTDDVAVLRGTRSRTLLLGEIPVTWVENVGVDGAVLDPKDYTVRRHGALIRYSGWGGPDSEVVVTYDHGFEDLPKSLFSVCVMATARLASNPEQLVREEMEGYSSASEVASGFTLSERAVLDRYRRRTLS